jgi:hypothetical protein
MAQAAVSPERSLRVALLWNGALQAEEILAQPREIKLGSGRDAVFALPEGVIEEEELTVLSADDAGYALQPSRALGGFLYVAGERHEAAELRAPQRLGPQDYGVVTVGSLAVFFQHVRANDQALPARLDRDFSVLACVGLSLFMHVTVLLFLFLIAAKEFAPVGDLELDTELVKKFMVVPPPIDEPLLQKRKSASEAKDHGLRDRDEGGKKQAKPEGRVGKKQATQEDTKITGEVKDEAVAKVRGMGLLGVLSGGGASGSLLDTPSLDKVLGGLGSVQNVTGRGSGGMGLRGSGSSGGGTGQGNLFGAGELGTGIGAGRGGKGRGAGGPGADGAKAKEAKLSLDNSAAQVKGFLSKEQIDRVVRANQAAIKYCFEAEMQHQPKLEGAVHMNWRIDLQGKVISARVAKSTLGNARVEGCMARQIKRWVFPKPDGGEVDVTYPFLLRGG